MGYPGGPVIDAAAQRGNPKAITFPRGLTASKDQDKHRFDYSFSGLKTSVARWVEIAERDGVEINVDDVAASFQEAVADVLSSKAVELCQAQGLEHFLIGGGVAANSRLRTLLEERLTSIGVELRRPRPGLCTDNGAMMAALGVEVVKAGLAPSSMDIGATPGLPISRIVV
ncbi:ubiquitin-like protein 5 [Platysternon megacephalum]|uniref:Ubiquitin-like protein 5 n=1 Tax=Platysternon megacephalum TaxID=55544 RepID=A0A4D9DCI6_9SAUR|nr:ubiquitin-like protein 5 [Platysternon megacephalum]